MRTPIDWSPLLCLSALSAAAAPPEPASCEFVRSVTEAESAVLLAPELFVSTGVVNAGQATGSPSDVPLGTPRLRITAGLGYDLVGVYQGVTMRHRAEAECQRQRALQALQTALQSGPDLGAAPALEARLAVLKTAIPEGERLIESLRGDLQAGRATLEELNVLQLRLDALRALESETIQSQERLAHAPPRPDRPLSTLLQELHSADDEIERLSGRLRSSSAWGLSLRAGYDELIHVPQDLPLFGTITLSYNLGAWSQAAANERARAARRQASEEEVEGLPRRVARLLQELRATQSAETARLQEVTVLAGDLESQLQSLQALETIKVRRFHDYLVLELARLRAEQAWLHTHLEFLGAFLGKEAP
jgi:hypothetical protein